jgi:hypothetical protein
MLAAITGKLLAMMLSPILLIPAGALAWIAPTWRSLGVASALLWIVVMTVQMNARFRTAKELGLPDPSYAWNGLFTVAAISLVVLLVLVVRRLSSGHWPSR